PSSADLDSIQRLHRRVAGHRRIHVRATGRSADLGVSQRMITDVEAAVRRMRAVVGVLDEDLATYERLLATPLPYAALPADAWPAAEAARRRVEESLRGTELAAADAVARARSWREKAALASTCGRAQLAEQARGRAATADHEATAYVRESSAIRVFLAEWDVR